MEPTSTDNTNKYPALPPVTLRPATIQDIPHIQHIVSISWPDTYGEILSKEQLDYMIDRMYNTRTLTEQIGSTHHYFILWEGSDEGSAAGVPVGFIDVEKQDALYCKLHKIYLLPACKGKGYGKRLMDYALQQSQALGARFLKLNVNRYNNALGFYERMGFRIAETVDNAIGQGYYMNDYVMIRPLEA